MRKKFEYHIHEIEFKRDYPGLMVPYIEGYSKDGWELVFMHPLQTVETHIAMPNKPIIKISFLCVFKRRKKWMKFF